MQAAVHLHNDCKIKRRSQDRLFYCKRFTHLFFTHRPFNTAEHMLQVNRVCK